MDGDEAWDPKDRDPYGDLMLDINPYYSAFRNLFAWERSPVMQIVVTFNFGDDEYYFNTPDTQANTEFYFDWGWKYHAVYFSSNRSTISAKYNLHFFFIIFYSFLTLAGIGSLESKRFISDNTPINEDRIRYSKVIRREDRAFYESNWPDSSKLEKFKNFLKILDDNYWNGFGGQEFIVVLEWNTPNNTISCLWKNNIKINDRKWTPLFPRS